MQESWTHRHVEVNGIRLHLVEAGAGPLVILLHGFPEFWYSWRRQIPCLAEQGFHVVAPDLRGYNQSDKPPGVASYRSSVLVEDVDALITHLGEQNAVVVGHDWGGVVAWMLAAFRPHRVTRLVILDAPHPATFLGALSDPGQLLRSWYVLFFQLPWLPEWVSRRGNFALLERMLREEPIHRGAFTEADIVRYKEALAQPGALTATINYYRALGRDLGRSVRPFPRIGQPTLLIWGKRDRHLGMSLTRNLERWVDDLRIEYVSDASHWIQNDVPERINRLLGEFLAGPGTRSSPSSRS